MVIIFTYKKSPGYQTVINKNSTKGHATIIICCGFVGVGWRGGGGIRIDAKSQKILHGHCTIKIRTFQG
jgi:hypothetical protein